MDLQIFDIRSLLKQFKGILNQNESDQKEDVNDKDYLSKFFKKIKSFQQFEGIQSIDQLNFNKDFKQVFNFPYHKQQTQSNKIEGESVEKKMDESKEYSDTVSLSLINDQNQLDFKNYLDWQSVLEKYGEFFQPVKHFRSYIRANKFDDILNNLESFEIIQDSTKVYQGYNSRMNQWIVVREQEVINKSLLDTAQQYLIHDYIYNLYPQIFLQILKPVYVDVDQFDKTKFISQLEFGEINLYSYSLQNTIEEHEFQLIFQQLYEQIKLLHKHNIAHRDIKPHNIIFVENKGWVLCDFGDSIQYDKVSAIYSIKGTYAFLQAYLQRQSRIQGILIKQNLLENDLYALAITLIVVKYQIKNQTEISQYLNLNNDFIINTLLEAPQFEILDKIIIQKHPLFIKPYVQRQIRNQSVKDIDIFDFVGYISLLFNSNITVKLSEEIKTKIIDIINCKLALKDDYYNYINILCYVRIPGYLKYFKNLISYRELRQPTYWRNIWRNFAYQKNHEILVNQIKFMYDIGLTDLTYEFAKLYLQNDYDFSIQIIIIRLLLLFEHKDKAQQELNQIFLFRSFKQMNQEQLFQLIELTLNNFSWDIISAEDMEYFRKLGIQGEYYDICKLLNEDLNEQEFINKTIENFNRYLQFGYCSQSIGSIFKYIEDALTIKSIYVSLGLIEQLKKSNLKYSCTTHHWQKLIQYQIDIYHSIHNKMRVNQLTKKMNYILIYNSESKSQQQILRLIKLNSYTNCLIKKAKQQKIIKQLRNIIDSYESLSIQFYKYILISEIINMFQQITLRIFLYKGGDRYLLQFFDILSFIFMKQHFFEQLKEEDQIQFTLLMILLYQETLNNRRFYKLLKNKQEQMVTRYRATVNSREAKIKNLINNKSNKKLGKIFLLNQYFERN